MFHMLAEGMVSLDEEICVSSHMGGKAGAPVVPAAPVVSGDIHDAGTVYSKDVLVSQKFMKPVQVHIEGGIPARIPTEAESEAADETVHAGQVDVRPLAGSKVCIAEMGILQLSLGFYIPAASQVFFPAIFKAQGEIIILIVPMHFVSRLRVKVIFIGQAAIFGNQVRIVSMISQTGIVEPEAIPFIFSVPIDFLEIYGAIHIVEGHALHMPAKGSLFSLPVIAQFVHGIFCTIGIFAAQFIMADTGPQAITVCTVAGFTEALIQIVRVNAIYALV